MPSKWIGFWAILIFGFLLRVIPAQGHNFYFTIDQGHDAVYVREIFERGQILFKGPPTSIEGIYAGPGWYYFISIGYKLFDGDPFGALFMVILLSLATTGILMFQIGKRVSPGVGLLVGASLQFFWFFYDTSRWAFNPFPLVFLSVVLILLFVRFLEGNKKAFPFALLPIFLAFNTEVAGATALLIFHIVFGGWAVTRKLILLRTFVVWSVLLPALGGTLIGYQFLARFIQTRFFLAQGGAGLGTFGGTDFIEVGKRFSEMVSYVVIPQNLLLSLVVFGAVAFFFWRKKTNRFSRRFVALTLTLFLVSFLFFGATRGWRDWHTVYLPPLLFVSLILMLVSIPKKAGFIFFAIIISGQAVLFGERYSQYLRPSDDPSILANQLQVLDWIYQGSEGDGFNVYTYTPHERDYPYQYLFWWYGRKAYGFVPCEYATYPGELKYLYIPGAYYYQEPQLGCDKFRFFIIDGESEGWHEKVAAGTKLVEEKVVGRIKVEKRALIH